MKASELKAWFAEDVSRWEALSDASKHAMQRYCPYAPAEENALHARKSEKPSWGFVPNYSRGLRPLSVPSKKRKTRIFVAPKHERHADVLNLADGTLTVSEIADKLSIQTDEVHSSLAFLRRKGHLPTFKTVGKATEKRNAEIVKLYYHLNLTLEEIGSKFGLTRSRVQQIISRERMRK